MDKSFKNYGLKIAKYLHTVWKPSERISTENVKKYIDFKCEDLGIDKSLFNIVEKRKQIF
jgi:hypothetical protein